MAWQSVLLMALGAVVIGSATSVAEAKLFGLSERLQFSAATKKACVFNFPRDFTLGQILIDEYPGRVSEKSRSGAARGKVTVPAGRYVTFVPSRRFYEKPELVNYLPAEGVDCLEMTASSLDDSEDGMCDRALAHIGRLKSVVRLNLDRSDATDKGVQYARDLPELQEISGFASMIEGSCFAQFSGLKKLSILMMHGSPIKDENLKYLPAIPRLKGLSLGSTGVSDIGMGHLVGCHELYFLDVGLNGKITDRSVESLTKLKSLRELDLSNTSITYSGLMRMKGMALERFTLPAKIYTVDQLKNLHKAFPKTALIVNGSGVRAVTPETQALYSPLH
jgi:hypothetical protein